MRFLDERRIPVRDSTDITHVRAIAREFGTRAELGLVDLAKFITASSDLARNLLVHAVGGEVHIQLLHQNGRRGVRATFTDQGPGIEDLEAAMKVGHSTVGSQGLGLPGAKRLSGDFSIRTGPDGTRVVIATWKR